jgi:CRISPR-associated protein Cas2
MTSFFLSYDISDDRLRTRLSKLLERRGCKRLQKSVFFAPNFEPREMQSLRIACERLLQHRAPTDSLLCIPATRQYLGELVWQGDAARLQAALTDVLFTVM